MPATATTAMATGAYRLQQDDPDELVLVRETVAAMRDFAGYTAQTRYDPGCVANGRAVVTTTAEGVVEQRQTAAHHALLGIDGIELLDGDEARRRFPFLTPAVRQVRYRQDDGMMDPRRLALGLAGRIAGARRHALPGRRLRPGGRRGDRRAHEPRDDRDAQLRDRGRPAVGRRRGSRGRRAADPHAAPAPPAPARRAPGAAGRAARLRPGHRRALAAGAARRVRAALGAGRHRRRRGRRPARRSGLPVQAARSGEPDGARPDDDVLARRLGGRPGAVGVAVRPLHRDARLPPADRRDADLRASTSTPATAATA